MAFNAYLVFHPEKDDFKGESSSELFKGKGAIEIADYGFAAAMPVTASRSDGGGATVGRAVRCAHWRRGERRARARAVPAAERPAAQRDARSADPRQPVGRRDVECWQPVGWRRNPAGRDERAARHRHASRNQRAARRQRPKLQQPEQPGHPEHLYAAERQPAAGNPLSPYLAEGWTSNPLPRGRERVFLRYAVALPDRRCSGSPV